MKFQAKQGPTVELVIVEAQSILLFTGRILKYRWIQIQPMETPFRGLRFNP